MDNPTGEPLVKVVTDTGSILIPKDIRKIVDIEGGDLVELYVVQTTNNKKYIMIGRKD